MAKNTITGFLKLDSSQFNRQLGATESRLTRFGKNVAKGAVAVGAGATAAFVAAKPLADAASALNEQAAKAGVVFGDSVKPINDFAAGAVETAGLSRRAATEISSMFGQFGKQAGLTGDELAKFSLDFTQLAADFGSFNDLATEDAAGKLLAGLSGEAEPLKRFGKDLMASTVSAKALEMGLADTVSELTEADKVAARAALIFEQMGDETGDFARNQDTLATKSKQLSATFENLQAKIGEKLLPLFIAVATWMLEELIPAAEAFGRKVEEVWPRIRDVVVDVFGRVRVAAEQAFGWIEDNVIPIVEDVAGIVVDSWPQIQDVAETVFGFIVDEVVPALEELATTVRDTVGKAVKFFSDNTDVLWSALAGLGGVILAVVVPAFWLWAKAATAAAVKTALAAAPAIAIAVAIGALAAALIYAYQNWEAFRTIVDTVAKLAVEAAGWIVDAFGKIPDIIDAFKPTFEAMVEVVEGFIMIVEGLVEFIAGVFTGDWGAAWDGIKLMFEGVWTAIVGGLEAQWEAMKVVWGNIIGWFGDLGGLILGALADFGSLLLQKGKDLLQGLWDGIQENWVWILAFFAALPIAIPAAIVGIGVALFSKGTALIGGLWKGIEFGWNLAKGWFSGFGDMVGGLVGDLGEVLKEAGRSLIRGLIEGINEMLDPLRWAWNNTAGRIPGVGTWDNPNGGGTTGPFSGANFDLSGWTAPDVNLGGLGPTTGSGGSYLGNTFEGLVIAVDGKAFGEIAADAIVAESESRGGLPITTRSGGGGSTYQ